MMESVSIEHVIARPDKQWEGIARMTNVRLTGLNHCRVLARLGSLSTSFPSLSRLTAARGTRYMVPIDGGLADHRPYFAPCYLR